MRKRLKEYTVDRKPISATDSNLFHSSRLQPCVRVVLLASRVQAAIEKRTEVGRMIFLY